MNSGELVPMIVLPTFALVVGWIVRVVSGNRRLAASAKHQAETQAKLLDRFGTAQEMQQFLQSEAGRRFLESSTVERANPVDRILSSVQTGILVLLASAGVYFSRDLVGEDAMSAFGFLGTVGMLLGAGFVVSAGAVFFISRSLGLEVGRRSGAPVRDNE